MKRVILTLAICFATLGAYATESTDFLAKTLTDRCGKKVKVVSKAEMVSEYQQKVGDVQVYAVAYGNGYMKPKRERKTWISYICLLDENCNPIWGEVSEECYDSIWDIFNCLK